MAESGGRVDARAPASETGPALHLRPLGADDPGMEIAVLVLTLGCTLAVALGLSWLVLGFMLHAMAGDLSPLLRAWRLFGRGQ
jgi:hypothetical protein